ncbi:MAG: helix-turn-helix domain-containing protein [Saprospiraceae bacterium]
MQNLHFLPAPLLAFGWVSWLEEVPANWFFGVANALTFTYLVVAILWAKKHRHQLNMTAAWRKGFFAGLGMFCCIFLLLMFCQTVGNTYLLVTSLAALVLYGLSFWAIQHLVLAASFVKKKHHPPEEAAAALRELANRVAALFEKEEIYTDATLTVQKLAQHIQVQPYLLSKAVNFHFGKSFPELLGQYRIRHAENMLQSPIGDGLSIEGIAYESGFASVSAFYAAFKKQHGITPADFKRRRAIVGEGMGGLSSRKAVLK